MGTGVIGVDLPLTLVPLKKIQFKNYCQVISRCYFSIIQIQLILFEILCYSCE